MHSSQKKQIGNARKIGIQKFKSNHEQEPRMVNAEATNTNKV